MTQSEVEMRRALEERLQFEALLADLSTGLVSDLFANTLARRRSEQSLHQTLTEKAMRAQGQ